MAVPRMSRRTQTHAFVTTRASQLSAEVSPFSVVAKTESKNRVTPKWIFQELSMAIRAKIISTVMTCLRFLISRDDRFMHPLENLV